MPKDTLWCDESHGEALSPTILYNMLYTKDACQLWK